MQKAHAASEIALSPPHLGGEARPTWLGLGSRVFGALESLSSAQTVLTLGAALFLLAAWPLALTEHLPYQDLPNHQAAMLVIRHPELYPEFVTNGFLKTNSAFFLWLLGAGPWVSDAVATKLFALLVLALGAFAFPWFVLSFTNRKRAVLATFFVWPMVHNWFVCMGMMDFALSVPLSLISLVLLLEQSRNPTTRRGLALSAVLLFAWYAHVFPVLVVLLLSLFHVLVEKGEGRFAQARRVFPPLLLPGLLSLWSLWLHTTEPTGPITGNLSLHKSVPFWELAYNLWAEWFWGFTSLSMTSLAPCLILAVLGLSRLRAEKIPFFSVPAFVALSLLYAFMPYTATNWFHVNSRVIPFLWAFLLLRLPDELPRKWLAFLSACAVLYSLGQGVDFVRLDKDRALFTAGMSAVPERAKLLPLVFRQKHTSENTKSVLHAWGYYAMEKHTTMPLLFAHSRSFPIMSREAPKEQWNHLVLESWSPNMQKPASMCLLLREYGVAPADCEAEWRARWREFWQEASAEFDHILMWSPQAEVLSTVPSTYQEVFRGDQLRIYRRVPTERAAP